MDDDPNTQWQMGYDQARSDCVEFATQHLAEIERLRAALQSIIAENYGLCSPHQVRMAEIAADALTVYEQKTGKPVRCRICGKHSTDPCHDHKSGAGLGCRQNKEFSFYEC